MNNINGVFMFYARVICNATNTDILSGCMKNNFGIMQSVMLLAELKYFQTKCICVLNVQNMYPCRKFLCYS